MFVQHSVPPADATICDRDRVRHAVEQRPPRPRSPREDCYLDDLAHAARIEVHGAAPYLKRGDVKENVGNDGGWTNEENEPFEQLLDVSGESESGASVERVDAGQRLLGDWALVAV